MYEPLKGIRVIDFTTAGAGPSCTKLLTEYGAENILVEPFSGNTTRTVFKMDFYNTGKQSIVLDLKTDMGKEVMLRLVKDADVFVSNYRTAALERLGLTYEELRELNPTLIYATITGYGEEGKDAHCPGYDPVAFWARGGLSHNMSEEDLVSTPPVAMGDIATGQALAGGICAALYQRERTGKGDRVFTSLLAEAAYLNHDAMIQIQYGDRYPQPRKAPRRSMLNSYRCMDGKWIVIAAFDFERYFWNILEAVGRGDLVGDSRWTCLEDTMYGGAPEIVDILDKAFGRMSQDEAIAAMEEIDVPCGRVQSTEDLLRDPQCLVNKYIFPIRASDGKELLIPANPVKFTDKHSGTADFHNGPRLGEHSVKILREWGYSDGEIARMVREKVTMDPQGELKTDCGEATVYSNFPATPREERPQASATYLRQSMEKGGVLAGIAND